MDKQACRCVWLCEREREREHLCVQHSPIMQQCGENLSVQIIMSSVICLKDGEKEEEKRMRGQNEMKKETE